MVKRTRRNSFFVTARLKNDPSMKNFLKELKEKIAYVKDILLGENYFVFEIIYDFTYLEFRLQSAQA